MILALRVFLLAFLDHLPGARRLQCWVRGKHLWTLADATDPAVFPPTICKHCREPASHHNVYRVRFPFP